MPTSLDEYRMSHATDPNFEDSPSRRALHGFDLVKSGGTAPNQKYNHFMKSTAAKNLQGRHPDDGYNYFGIEAILAAANQHFNFETNIDDSDEDQISDDELRNAIKMRKETDQVRRDDLTTVKYAALQAMKSVDEVRKQISVVSLFDKSLNLDALRAKQTRLRDSMNEELPQKTTLPEQLVVKQLNSPTQMKSDELGQSGVRKIMQRRYQQPQTEENNSEDSGSSQDEFH